MPIQVKSKINLADPPAWRVEQPAVNVPSLLEPVINAAHIRPRHDQVHYETHLALPDSLARAINNGHRYHVNPGLEWASGKIPALQSKPAGNGRTRPELAGELWRAGNRIYVATSAVVWRLYRHSGMVAMEHILWAECRTERRMVLHTRENEFQFPPLCRPEATVAAINQILAHGANIRFTPRCESCRHYWRRPTPGNQGDCAIQSEISQACCALNGLMDRCQLHEHMAKSTAIYQRRDEPKRDS